MNSGIYLQKRVFLVPLKSICALSKHIPFPYPRNNHCPEFTFIVLLLFFMTSLQMYVTLNSIWFSFTWFHIAEALFYCCKIFHHLTTPKFIIHLIVSEYLGCSQLLAVINNIAINILVLSPDMFMQGYRPTRKIPVLQEVYILNSINALFFSKVVVLIYSLSLCSVHRQPSTHHPYQLWYCQTFCQSNGCKMVSLGFCMYCHVLMSLSMFSYLFAICLLCLLVSFVHFPIGLCFHIELYTVYSRYISFFYVQYIGFRFTTQ